MSSATELAAWLNGIPTGGPNSDGRYPLTYADDLTYLVYCPEAQALNPALAEAPIEVFANTASTAAATATAESTEAQQAALNAQTYAANALVSANISTANEASTTSALGQCNTAASGAAGYAATANTHKLAAADSATAADISSVSASGYATSASNSATAAAGSAADAAASNAGKAPLDSPAFIGNPSAPNFRLPSSGPLYLNGTTYTRYLYYDGTSYHLPGAALVIDGSTAWTGANFDPSLKANLASPTFTGTVGGITKTMVGLGSVDNTADTAKPVSTAQQTALNLKANLASPTFTGTVGGITATMVGLGSVNNTADSAKPVSTTQQTALDLKANLASPTFTGTVISGDIASTNSISADGVLSSGGTDQALMNGYTDIGVHYNRIRAQASMWGSPYTELLLGSNGTLTLAGNGIWHAGNFTPANYAPLAGATFTGDVTVNRGATAGGLFLDSNAGVVSDLRFYKAGSLRWLMRRDAATESGGNVGSDFSLAPRDDAGNALSGGFNIARSTGVMLIYRLSVQAADNTGGILQPRTFVQSGDPGAKAADGDLWIW